jgi:hypothetical protein
MFSIDGAAGSAVSVGLLADASGLARINATLRGGASSSVSTFAVEDDADQLTAGEWYEVAVQVDPSADTVELDVTANDPAFGMLKTQVTQASWQGTDFTPSAVAGSLRVGSAQPTVTSPTTPVFPWSGEVDELLAFRGSMPSLDGRWPLGGFVRWATQARVAGGGSPCP